MKSYQIKTTYGVIRECSHSHGVDCNCVAIRFTVPFTGSEVFDLHRHITTNAIDDQDSKTRRRSERLLKLLNWSINHTIHASTPRYYER